MFAFGTRVVFDELPVTDRLAGAISRSPTVKAIAPVLVFLVVVWSAIDVIVGGVGGGTTLTHQVLHRPDPLPVPEAGLEYCCGALGRRSKDRRPFVWDP